MVTNPLPGVLHALLLLLERSVLGNNGCSQTLIKGKIMGRFVVTTAMNVSLVPHSAANAPPLTGSCVQVSTLANEILLAMSATPRRFRGWNTNETILTTIT
jgi:hypothetical protein